MTDPTAEQPRGIPTAAIPAPAPPAAAKPAGGGAVRALTVLLSLLALVLAIVAVGLGVYAIGQATDAKRASEQALSGGKGAVLPSSTTAVAVPQESSAQVAPTPSDPGPLPTGPVALDPKATFDNQYKRQLLTIAATCYNSRYVDIDEPRVGVAETKADLTFRAACQGSPATIEFVSAEAAEAAGAQVTPNECAELFRTAPLARESRNPVNRGDFFCASTTAAQAQLQGSPRRIALVEVVATAADGKVVIAVTAWNVPG